MKVVSKFGGFGQRAGHGSRGRGGLPLIGLCLAGFIGCATASAPKAEETATVQRLRAENIAGQRKLEELENQVFILNSALENRRRGEPPPPATATAPSLPEIKLTRGERVPPPVDARASTPASLVDETEVEYTGAAADGSSKRPVLRLWGTGAGEAAISEEPQPRTTTSDRARNTIAKDATRTRAGRRLALGHSSGEVSPPPNPVPSEAASILSDAAETREAEEEAASDSKAPPRSTRAGTKTVRPTPPAAERGARTKETPKATRDPSLGHGKGSKASRSSASDPAKASPAPVEPAKPNREPAKSPLPGATKGSGTALYNDALEDLRQGRHDEAVAGLRAFVRAHARHDLADNAQYWLGECFYDRKDYAAAAREFSKVGTDFPAGNKVPDAQLKLGLSYLALGNLRPARASLSDVIRRFPQHPAAALAGAKVASIGAASPASDASAALTARPVSKEVR